MEVTVGGAGGQRRSGRGQGGRGTRSGMSGDSNGAGSLSSEAVGDVVGMEISIPESTLVEDGNNFISFSDIDREWRVPASTEPFWRRDDNVVGVEAGGDASLDLGSEFCGEEDLEWYSCAGNEAAYCQAATESHNANVGDGVAGGSGVVPAPYEGQGSAMYTYHECGKMRVGTLNIRGSLRGASEVCAVRLGVVCGL